MYSQGLSKGLQWPKRFFSEGSAKINEVFKFQGLEKTRKTWIFCLLGAIFESTECVFVRKKDPPNIASPFFLPFLRHGKSSRKKTHHMEDFFFRIRGTKDSTKSKLPLGSVVEICERRRLDVSFFCIQKWRDCGWIDRSMDGWMDGWMDR